MLREIWEKKNKAKLNNANANNVSSTTNLSEENKININQPSVQPYKSHSVLIIPTVVIYLSN